MSVSERGAVGAEQLLLGLEPLPLVEHAGEILQLVPQPDDAVGVERAQLAEVHAGLAPPAQVLGVDELHRHAVPRRQLVLHLVEHELVVLPRVPGPRRVPVREEGQRPRPRLGVEEPAVGRLVEVVGVVAVEPVAVERDVGAHRDAQQRVPEPHDVHVREHEAEPQRQHPRLELVPRPHHVQVAQGVVRLLRREVRRRCQAVAERVHALAPLQRLAVHGHDHQVLQQRLRPHADAEALQEHVQQRPRRRPRLVREGHYDGVVVHGRAPQQLRQLLVVVLFPFPFPCSIVHPLQ
uniref:Uncharacterized protein n=1 Tax=Triticum urartu TaxID=4572 RepID=A0A8R7P9S9_TRIUA